MKVRSAIVIVCVIGMSLGIATPKAGAAFHLMKVREIYAGSLVEANADFIELQMYSAGQTQVANHKLRVYDTSGSFQECTIPASVTNPANQETILFATTQAQTALSTTADFTIPPLISGSGGAVCFENVDCVSWGSFSGATTSAAGTPESGGIPAGQSIDRRTDVSGGATTLEDTDDTNDSANDFEAESPSPNPNSPVNLGTATCAPSGGETPDTEKPESKITAPKHNTAITQGEARNFQGTGKDPSGSGVAKIEIALRQKLKGACKWWNGTSFIGGSCSTKNFVMASGDKKWTYMLSKNLKRTGARIRNYTFYSRATDESGNIETAFEAGRNQVKFEVYKPPITCGPGC